MSFIYDSLDTVKSLQFPTKQQFLSITLAIFVVLIISGLLFVLFDSFFASLYRALYFLVTG